MKHTGNAVAIILICFFAVLFSLSSSLNSDGLSLLALKAAINNDPKKVLSNWLDTDTTPCSWNGITCDSTHQRVTHISLSGRGLTGYIPFEIGGLSAVTTLILSFNNFSKPIPVHLFNATSLYSLDLSHNSFYGPLPYEISSLRNLVHLDLSSNKLNGSLPESLSCLNHLSGTLNLSCNKFSGEIPTSFGSFPVILSFDLRENNLTGKIPQVGSLLNQGPTAFSGNPFLCGFPSSTPCTIEAAAAQPRVLTDPEKPGYGSTEVLEKSSSKKGSLTFSVISGFTVVIGVVFVSVWLFRKRWDLGKGKLGREKLEKEVGTSELDEVQKGKFVVVDEGFRMELEDLLRASAYVVGKSRGSILYKVVAGIGGRGGSGVGGRPAVVAVRRLSDGDGVWKFKEFQTEVETIAKVQHPNIVKLRAYYYATDEKLLISDFIPNGSLHNALHGGPGNLLPPLTWAARLKIAQGAARGLMYIHDCSPRKYVHGNVRSSKILLDDDLNPYLSGFGLFRLVPGTSKSTNGSMKRQNSCKIVVSSKCSTSSSDMYLAPEARLAGGKFTQKCDVYSFGCVLLEILTGRVPGTGPENEGKGLENLVRKVFRDGLPLSEIIDPKLLQEIHAKMQVVAAFHIALNCTELDPEFRPRMRLVCESLDSIKLQ